MPTPLVSHTVQNAMPQMHSLHGAYPAGRSIPIAEARRKRVVHRMGLRGRAAASARHEPSCEHALLMESVCVRLGCFTGL